MKSEEQIRARIEISYADLLKDELDAADEHYLMGCLDALRWVLRD